MPALCPTYVAQDSNRYSRRLKGPRLSPKARVGDREVAEAKSASQYSRTYPGLSLTHTVPHLGFGSIEAKVQEK